MQGGQCTRDDQCYSGLCWQQSQTCASDSRTPGKVGDGGNCRTHYNCYSNNCLNQICTSQSAGLTSLPCTTDIQCAGSRCINSYCQPITSGQLITGGGYGSGTIGTSGGLPAGSQCSFPSQCLSQSCIGSICSQTSGNIISNIGSGSYSLGR